MPNGVLQWFDDAAGEGRIIHAGRRYKVERREIEPEARAAGARVHFDIDPHAKDVAVNVSLRHGTRVNRRQRRFGDQTGTRSPDAGGPIPLVTEWTSLLARGELDDLMALYAPSASLHAEGETLVGSTAIRRYWERSPLLRGPAPSSIRGDDDAVRVEWDALEPGGETVASRLVVRRGEIVEQRMGAEAVLERGAQAPIQVSTDGAITEDERTYALRKLEKVLDDLERPVLHAQLRLYRAADPARERPVLARATVDVDGEPVRAHVAGQTAQEAVDLLEARLRDRLDRVEEQLRTLRRRSPTSPPGEWRHGDLPAPRPPFFPRPVEEREIVRHKTFSPEEATVDEAIYDMEAMDLDFLLFVDLATGDDSLVHRLPGGAYGVVHLNGGGAEPSPPSAAAVEVDPRPAPDLSVQEARERLDAGGEPWVFFRDTGTGRCHVLYRRYDGHYGLITPAG